MPFTISIDDAEPCLLVTAAGRAGLPELSGLATLVAEVANRRGRRLALVDLGSVEPQLSFTEHLQFGAQASALLARLKMVSVVVPPGYLNAPSEKAAQMAGLRVRTFLTLSEARAWIETKGMA